MRRRVRWVLAPAAIGLIGVSAAACSTGTSGTPATDPTPATAATAATAAAGNGECAAPGAPVVELATYASTDPVVAVPVPDGWERNTSMDSELIRGNFGNRSLPKDGFGSNVTIAMEDVTGTAASAQEGVQAQVDSIAAIGGQLVGKEDMMVCGNPAALAQVRLPAIGSIPERDGSLLIVVSESAGTLTATVLTLQTLDSADPDYLADAATIMAGVQITPQGGRH